MAGLCGGMNDSVRPDGANHLRDSLPVAYVEFVMAKTRKLLFETFSVPTCVTLRSEKIPAHIVVNAMDFPTFGGKECNNFAANQAA